MCHAQEGLEAAFVLCRSGQATCQRITKHAQYDAQAASVRPHEACCGEPPNWAVVRQLGRYMPGCRICQNNFSRSPYGCSTLFGFPGVVVTSPQRTDVLSQRRASFMPAMAHDLRAFVFFNVSQGLQTPWHRHCNLRSCQFTAMLEERAPYKRPKFRIPAPESNNTHHWHGSCLPR